MLIPILLITFGVLSSATEDDFCDQGAAAHCFTNAVNVDFPDSEEALDKACPILIPRVKCMLDFKNKCSVEIRNFPFENIENLYGLFVEACDKDSKFHRELALHLPCIAQNMDDHFNTCKPMVKEALEEMTSDLNLDWEAETVFSDQEISEKYLCMSEALGMSCFVASTTARCDEKTGEMVGDVLDQIGVLNAICPESMREEVNEAISILQPIMQLRIVEDELLSMLK